MARALGIVGFGALICGCSETFADQIRDHRGCIGEAQISSQTVDTCLRNTNGRRQNVNIGLVDDMVLDHNIRMLNDCATELSIPGTITANYLCTYGITTMGEPGLRIGRGDRLQRLLEGWVECLAGAGLGLTQDGFELGPALLDRIEVRLVRGQRRQPRAPGCEGLTNPRRFVHRQVVPHHDVARPQGRPQHLGEVDAEDLLSTVPSTVIGALSPSTPIAASSEMFCP